MNHLNESDLNMPKDEGRWAYLVNAAIEEFCRATSRNKGDLARALSISPSDLSISHLASSHRQTSIQQRLLQRMRRSSIRGTAIALELDVAGYRCLESLFAKVIEAIIQWPIVPVPWKHEEALELGLAGVELFRRNRWDAASSLLAESWGLLLCDFPDNDSGRLKTALRIGSEFASWQAYAGHTKEALLVVRKLLDEAKKLQAHTPDDMVTVGHLYNCAGVIFRLNGYLPQLVVAYLRKAHDICKASDGGTVGQIATLRDQAKPLMLHALTDTSGLTGATMLAESLAQIEYAEVMSRTAIRREQNAEPWIFTRLVQIECLCAIGNLDAATRIWEETIQTPEASDLTRDHPTPMSSKIAMVELALQICRRDLNQVASDAAQFQVSYRDTEFGERISRAREMELLANQGDVAGLKLAILK